MKKSNCTVKHCEYVQQLKHLQISLDDIPKIISDHTIIKEWAYIIHNKDTYKEDDKAVLEGKANVGDSVEPHIHLYMNFGNSAAKETDVAKWFKDSVIRIERIKGRKADILKYLTHKNAPTKHQYNIEEVVTNIDITKEIEKAETAEANRNYQNNIDDILHKIADGTIREYNRFDYIDEAILAKNANLFKNAFKNRSEKIMRDPNRNLNVIFIYGTTGSGKTTYAKELASTVEDGSYYISSSANDSLQDYAGQETLILDDLRDNVFEFADLLKVLDNHTATSIKSRFYNKTFLGSTVIITTTDPIENWYHWNSEDKGQLRRRISNYLVMDSEKIDFYVFDPDFDYNKKLEHTIPNPIPAIIAKRVKTQQEKNKILDMCEKIVTKAGLDEETTKEMVATIEKEKGNQKS